VDAQFPYSQASVEVAVASTHVLEVKHHLLADSTAATHALHPVGSGLGFGVGGGVGGGVGVALVQSASVMGTYPASGSFGFVVLPFWQCATAFFGQGHVKELVGFASRT
jgi:hypothetical protein